MPCCRCCPHVRAGRGHLQEPSRAWWHPHTAQVRPSLTQHTTLHLCVCAVVLLCGQLSFGVTVGNHPLHTAVLCPAHPATLPAHSLFNVGSLPLLPSLPHSCCCLPRGWVCVCLAPLGTCVHIHTPDLSLPPCSALYSTHRGNYNRGGMLTTAADFFGIFNSGMRGGERHFFTYVLCEDSLRCG